MWHQILHDCTLLNQASYLKPLTLLTCIRLAVFSDLATTPTIPTKVFHGFSQFRTANVVTVRYIWNIFPTSQFANWNHYLNCLNHSRCRYFQAERWVLSARGRIGYSTKVGKKLNVFIQEARRPRYSTPDVMCKREPHETAGSVTF
jgi:hypothetical protein